MKKIALILFFVILTGITVYSQVPEKINYQAVIRNSSGELVTGQDVGIKVSILDETSSGDVLYSEEHAVSTNAYGQIAIEIGGGTLDSGDFSSIEWGISNKFLKLEVDIEGGTSYVPIGTSQLLSVPYALYATTAELLGTEGVYSTSSDTLFVVKDHLGNVVFAVFPDGAQVYVNEGAKGKVGGFAVSGRIPSKAGDVDILRVTADSTRIYVNEDTLGKGKVGGFAVSGRIPSKGIVSSLMDITKDNYFIGHQSGSNLSTGLYNSTLGYQSGLSIDEGSENAFIGYQSGYQNSTGSGNLFLGYQTGFSNEFGNYNSFLGYLAGYSNSTGVYNTFLGSFSGYSNTEGNNNTFVGDSTGYFNVDGIENTFLGTGCGKSNSSGISNVFIGNKSGFSNTSGSTNVFIGNRAGFFAVDGVHNVFIGDSSGYNSTHTWGNVNIGFLSGYNTTTGGANTYVGARTGYHTTTGFSNTFIGIEAGYSLGTKCCNTFVGDHAGYFVTNGESNILMGAYAGYNESETEIGSFANVFIGNYAGFNSIGGGSNVFLGFKSGYNNIESDANVFLGYESGYSNQVGNENVFIGSNSGYSSTDGWANIFIGPRAGLNNINGSSNICIGHQAGMNELGSNKLYIDNWEADSSHAFIFGNFASNNLRFNAKVGVGGNADENYDLTINPEWGAADIKLIGSSNGINYSTIGLVSKGTPIENSWHIEHSIDNHKFKLKIFDGSGWNVNLELDTLGNMTLNRGGINAGGNIVPINDNVNSLGSASNKWTEVFAVNGTIQTSDVRLKSNISNLGYGLNEIMKLRPVTFNWKDKPNEIKKLGLIAQEVDEIIKEVVYHGNDENETLGINYAELAPLLIKGMQDQQKVIENQQKVISDQQKQIDELKTENKEFKNRLTQIEELLKKK